MRLFCRVSIVEKDDRGYEKLKAKVDSDVELTEAPAIIPLDMWKVQTSCSFGVPWLYC